ncbi:MAG: MotA/TolQ/ExbB proton channel family protein [Bdellovibrionota bacterium]
MEFLSFIQDHFTHAAPVLLAAFFGVTIIIERGRALLQTYPLKDTHGFMQRIEEFVGRNEIAQAIALCDQHIEKPVAKVVKTALLRSHLPDEAVEQGLGIAISEEGQKIGKRTPFLATIANVATLMGLFGTIMGLIQSFKAVADADPAQKSALLSAGISTAMNATMLGLGVAIPCMVAYAFLMNRSNKLQADVEESALKTLDVLRMRYFRPELSNGRGAHKGIQGAA